MLPKKILKHDPPDSFSQIARSDIVTTARCDDVHDTNEGKAYQNIRYEQPGGKYQFWKKRRCDRNFDLKRNRGLGENTFLENK